MTRPLCPYPQKARYNGKGNPNDAASFVCADAGKREDVREVVVRRRPWQENLRRENLLHTVPIPDTASFRYPGSVPAHYG